MSDAEIIERMKFLTTRGRKITAELLELIRESEQRKLYRSLGRSNAFEWLVKDFKLSQPSANRRVLASRLLDEVPDLANRIESGVLNLSHVVLVQSAVRKEEKRIGTKILSIEKIEIFREIENKTHEAAERIIKKRFPETRTTGNSLRRLSDSESRLSVIISENCRSNIERSREILSHVIPDGCLSEIVDFVFNFHVGESDPLQKLTHRFSKLKKHRVITPLLRAKVLQRAGGRCEFIAEETGIRCESRTRVQVDHIKPLALGGTNDLENLRALCQAHNLHEAERILGPHIRRGRSRS
jgi:hypothetical protein